MVLKVQHGDIQDAWDYAEAHHMVDPMRDLTGYAEDPASPAGLMLYHQNTGSPGTHILVGPLGEVVIDAPLEDRIVAASGPLEYRRLLGPLFTVDNLDLLFQAVSLLYANHTRSDFREYVRRFLNEL